MAKRPVEVEFVAAIWNLALQRDARVAKYARHVHPHALQSMDLQLAYQFILERWAAGSSLKDEEAIQGLHNILLGEYQHLLEVSWDWMERLPGEQDPREYAKRVVRYWQARRRWELLKELAQDAAAAVDDEGKASRAIGDRAVNALIALESNAGATERLQSREDISDAELARVRSGEQVGISWGFPTFDRLFGPARPGMAVGVTGYPGTGKTQLVVNISRSFAVRDHPVITVPTEMAVDFQRRSWAIHGGLHQRLVEHQAWKYAKEEERVRYEEAVQDMRGLPWELVLEDDLTLESLMARIRVLRRKYMGRHVVVIVDHLYAIEYPGSDADKEVGEAARRLRKFAQADRDGGMTVIMVFQPRKPPDEDAIFHPVRAFQVKGTQIWPHVDIHMSPFRRVVATSQYDKTPWGSHAAQYGEDGWPERKKSDEPNSKVDDQHVYVKPDKIRTGGEGPLFMLEMDAPTGLIYEGSPHFAGDPFMLTTYNRHRDYLDASD